jgi:hypothetical protein
MWEDADDEEEEEADDVSLSFYKFLEDLDAVGGCRRGSSG